MKKAILLFVSALLGTFAYGQRHATRATSTGNPTGARTTTYGDTLALSNIAASDTLALYTYPGGGYVTGPNVYNDLGFAERYDINGHDSSITIIGAMTHFGGKVNPASANSVNLKVWGLSSRVTVTSSLAYRDFPSAGLDTVTVPFTQLGIGPSSDTVKSFFFPHPTDTIQGAFFIGYDVNYTFSALNGDTIGLYSTTNGQRNGNLYDITMNTGLGEDVDTTYDTVINVQNATLWSDYTWHDNYTQNDSMFVNLAVFPIVVVGHPTGISGVTHKDLTFFGNYPNPASDVTRIRFALARQADVTITLMDMQGHILHTNSLSKQVSGEHIVELPVATLPQGNYVYSIVTSSGDAIAGRLTVAH